jgi:hypothetical protein
VKYFFLTDNWLIGRVWDESGLWNEIAWRRQPDIERLSLSILERGEKRWLYQVEDAVLALEVKPSANLMPERDTTIGQVLLKRLITAEQVIELLCYSESIESNLGQ